MSAPHFPPPNTINHWLSEQIPYSSGRPTPNNSFDQASNSSFRQSPFQLPAEDLLNINLLFARIIKKAREREEITGSPCRHLMRQRRHMRKAEISLENVIQRLSVATNPNGIDGETGLDSTERSLAKMQSHISNSMGRRLENRVAIALMDNPAIYDVELPNDLIPAPNSTEAFFLLPLFQKYHPQSGQKMSRAPSSIPNSPWKL